VLAVLVREAIVMVAEMGVGIQIVNCTSQVRLFQRFEPSWLNNADVFLF
jgi:hypothetical protein